MKKNKWMQGISLAALLALNACSAADKVAFGTHTVYGLNVDTQPIPTFTLGLDRSELVVGPRYDNGAMPPVVASIKVKGGLFNTGISQVYATGDAAYEVTLDPDDPKTADRLPLQGGRKTMIFGTNTNLGIKATFVNNVPKSFNFGYKRQELSIIPLGTHNGVDTYASVLAAVDTDANMAGGVDTGYTAFLATGVAAKKMAGKPAIREFFNSEANQSFSSYSAYGGGVSSEKLSKFWMPDGKNRNMKNEAKIRDWMKNNGLRNEPHDIPMFLNNQMFLSARDQAVKDLKIK